tara:strand:+ start:143 stop:454 length:312 start_codon:yes stop_codon:yes gene_type:complete
MSIDTASLNVGSISVFISSAMASRVAAYATKHDQTVTDAVEALLVIALARIGASSAGGYRRWEGVSPEARSEAARVAVTERWRQYRLSREGLDDQADKAGQDQ